MHRFTEKAQETLVGTAENVEAIVIKDPVIGPVAIQDPLSPNVFRCCLVTIIFGREFLEVEKTREELHFVETARPRSLPYANGVNNVSACNFRDLIHLLGLDLAYAYSRFSDITVRRERLWRGWRA
jgi:hypothetical protein